MFLSVSLIPSAHDAGTTPLDKYKMVGGTAPRDMLISEARCFRNIFVGKFDGNASLTN